MPPSRTSRTGTTAYLNARRVWRARWKRMNAPCALCGGVILYDAPRTDPHSFVFGHRRSVIEFGEPRRYDASTMRPECRRCAIKDGAEAKARARAGRIPPRLPTTRQW